MKRYIKSSDNELWICNRCGCKFTLNNADVDYCLRPGRRSFDNTDTVPYYRCPKCGFSTIDRVQD